MSLATITPAWHSGCDNSASACLLLAVVLGLGSSSLALADILLDGTLSEPVELSRGAAGKDYVVPHSVGETRGGNLFHSFRTFDIQSGESATFTGPDNINNVISRVTGGAQSTINGLLRSQVGTADFWFINPAGVMFGPEAQVDVPGAFHVSTAAELRFADGTLFSAIDPAASSLTVAPPQAFGFVDSNPAKITVDKSNLQLDTGQTLSFVAGDLVIQGGQSGSIQVPSGAVNFVGVAAPGDVVIGNDAIDASAVDQFGDVTLTDDAIIDTSGNGGGTVRIRAGQFLVEQGSTVNADNQGAQHDTAAIDVVADSVSMVSGRLTADVHDTGDAGQINIVVRDLEVRNGGIIASGTLSRGAGGRIVIDAEHMLISGGGILGGAGGITTLSNSPFETANAGEIDITTGDLELVDGGAITSISLGNGNAGPITIRVTTGDMTLDHGTISASAFGKGDGDAGALSIEVMKGDLRVSNDALIASQTALGQGRGGNIDVSTGRLVIDTGGAITVETLGPGVGGELSVKAREGIILTNVNVNENRLSGLLATSRNTPIISEKADLGNAGRIHVSAPWLEVGDGGLISSFTEGGGTGGLVEIVVGRLILTGSGEILSSAFGSGNAGDIIVNAEGNVTMSAGSAIRTSALFSNAGNITLSAGDTLAMDNGIILSIAARGAGGEIAISVVRLLDLNDSQITSSVAGSDADSNAGNISIDPVFVVLDGSTLQANAVVGNGGNIRIVGENLIISPDSIIEASSELGIDGAILITAPETDISGSLTALPATFLNATDLLSDACSSRVGTDVSSLVSAGRGGISVDPGRPLIAHYAGHRMPPTTPKNNNAAAENPDSNRVPARSLLLIDLRRICGVRSAPS